MHATTALNTGQEKWTVSSVVNAFGVQRLWRALTETGLMASMKRFMAVLLSLSLVACLAVQAQTAEAIKIGAFLSLTGATASYGVSALNAIKLATEETNRAGGINGKQIELVVEDDHSHTQKVPGIVKRLIKEAKVHALLAEPVSTRAMAAAPIAQANRVVMISSASVKPELTMHGDYIFRACFTSSTEGEAIAKFAIDKLKAKRAAIVFDPQNDYAVVLAKFFSESFTKLGGEVRGEQTYQATDRYLIPQFLPVMTMNPDVIFAPGFYTTAPLVASTVKRLGFKATLIGSDGWDSPDLMKDGAEPFDGVYFANHFWVGSNDPVVQKFVHVYQAKYGVLPDAGAATAYDAARLLFDAFRRANTTESRAVRDALAATKDFPGVTGKITIDAQRNAQVPVYMLKIDKNGRFSLQ
jgi:branched-chain amino acid transport system substrate-binding protein